MNVLVTGSRGFIGSNLLFRLKEEEIEFDVLTIDDAPSLVSEKVERCDVLIHLAGVNRPSDDHEFFTGNVIYLQQIVDALKSFKKRFRLFMHRHKKRLKILHMGGAKGPPRMY